MPNTYAVIANGTVIACFIGDDTFAESVYPGSIRIDNLNPLPGIGWTYSSGAFTAPVIPPPILTNPLFSQKGFMDLFTQAELKTCLNYASNSALTDDQKANLNVFFQYFYHTPIIDMTMATTIAGLQMLEAYGLIGTGRAAQILASRN